LLQNSTSRINILSSTGGRIQQALKGVGGFNVCVVGQEFDRFEDGDQVIPVGHESLGHGVPLLLLYCSKGTGESQAAVA